MRPLIPFPALLLEERKILVITDLHIGWESSLASQGIHVPSQVDRLLSKTLAALEASEAEELLVLGDVKHTIAKAEFEEWRDIPFFFERILEKVTSISIVPGNHDGNLEALLPEEVKIYPSSGITIGDAAFFHGHKFPSPEVLFKCTRIITGHIHPKILLKDSLGVKTLLQVWVKTTCRGAKLLEIMKKRTNFKKLLSSRIECTVMPSFNDLLGGKVINLDNWGNQYMGPLIKSEVLNLHDAEIFLIDGTYLGNVKQLKVNQEIMDK